MFSLFMCCAHFFQSVSSLCTDRRNQIIHSCSLTGSTDSEESPFFFLLHTWTWTLHLQSSPLHLSVARSSSADCIIVWLPAPSGHLTERPCRQRHRTREEVSESVKVIGMCVWVCGGENVRENMVKYLFFSIEWAMRRGTAGMSITPVAD